jgi:hypothetical protein
MGLLAARTDALRKWVETRWNMAQKLHKGDLLRGSTSDDASCGRAKVWHLSGISVTVAFARNFKQKSQLGFVCV